VTPPRLLALIVVAGVLNACVSDADLTIACPTVRVLQDLDTLTRFDPGVGRDPTDVRIEAWINRVTGGCSRDEQDLLVDLVVEIGTRRGPANTSKQAEIRYFVAITDADRNILSRRSFVATAPYTSRKTISFADALSLNIPVSRGVAGDAFTVYVGLELSENELRFNRNKARR
jgi:hypothetical protein